MYKEFSGENFFIVGGGNSLNPSILSRLPPSKTICLNSSMVHLEEFFALFWMDHSWYKNERNRQVMQSKKISRKFFISSNKPVYNDKTFEWIKRTEVLCNFSKDTDDVTVIGNNIGTCCLHFLDKVKANKIFLLGFDGKLVDGKSHSHSEYDKPCGKFTLLNQITPCFYELNKVLKNIRVYNCYADSDIRCFPFISVEKALSQSDQL